jgi:hypothetical protein
VHTVETRVLQLALQPDESVPPDIFGLTDVDEHVVPICLDIVDITRSDKIEAMRTLGHQS